MAIPYFAFLIIWAVGVLVYFLFMAVHIYHLQRFGMMDFVIKVHIGMMIGITVVVMIVTFLLLQNVPWAESFELFSSDDFTVDLPTEF